MTNETGRNGYGRQFVTALVSALVGGIVSFAIGTVTVSARLAVVEAKVEDLRLEIRQLRTGPRANPVIPSSPSITETFHVEGHLR